MSVLKSQSFHQKPASAAAWMNLSNITQSKFGKTAAWIGLGLLVLASRIPFASKILYHWDSVNFAYAMREFNLAKEQPQPPGYILYVYLCRLFDLVFHDPQTTMVVISVIASVGAVVGMLWLGERLYSPRVGWIGALFLAASPLFWFYNEIALPHSVDTFLVIMGVLFLYRAMQGDRRSFYLSVVILAIAGGVRQQTLVFLAPLVLFAVRKLDWKTILKAGALGIFLCLAWFLPLINLNGGLAQYLKVMNDFSDRFQNTTSLLMGAGFFGLARNFTKLFLYTAYGWSIFIIPAVLWMLRTIPKIRRLKVSERTIFLVLWIAPAFIYYLFVHMGQQGLIFVFLPALILLSAAALQSVFQERSRILLVSTAILVLASAVIFLFFPEYPMGPSGQRLLTLQTIQNSDRYFSDRFAAIRQNYPPDQTIILSSNWHHVQFYLPEYHVFEFTVGSKWEIDEGAPVNTTSSIVKGTASDFGIKPEKAKVIIFDPQLFEFASSPSDIHLVALANQEKFGVLNLPANEQFSIQSNTFGMIYP